MEEPVETGTAPVSLTPAQALDAWLDQYIRNSAISRDTAAWNRIARSVGDIKAAIAAVQEV